LLNLLDIPTTMDDIEMGILMSLNLEAVHSQVIVEIKKKDTTFIYIYDQRRYLAANDPSEFEFFFQRRTKSYRNDEVLSP
jgi:hypothetical protein